MIVTLLLCLASLMVSASEMPAAVGDRLFPISETKSRKNRSIESNVGSLLHTWTALNDFGQISVPGVGQDLESVKGKSLWTTSLFEDVAVRLRLSEGKLEGRD